MTSRHMTYELDGIFGTRGQGQLISSAPAQQRMIRTPGLVPIRKTLTGYEAAPSYSGSAGCGDIDLPLIGTVSTTTLALAGVGIALAVGLVLMKRKG